MFRFVSFQSKRKPLTMRGCLLWYLIYKERRSVRRSLCFNTFGNFKRNLNKRHISLNKNWLNGREMSRQTSVNKKNRPTKHKLRNPTNRSKRQSDQAVKGSLSNNGSNAKYNVDSKTNLYSTTNLSKIGYFWVLLHLCFETNCETFYMKTSSAYAISFSCKSKSFS